MVIDALAAGKHVFVEKPLAISRGELHRVQEAYRGQPRPAIDGRLQSPFFAARCEDPRICWPRGRSRRS